MAFFNGALKPLNFGKNGEGDEFFSLYGIFVKLGEVPVEIIIHYMARRFYKTGESSGVFFHKIGRILAGADVQDFNVKTGLQSHIDTFFRRSPARFVNVESDYQPIAQTL